MVERKVTIAMILKDLFSKQALKIGNSVDELSKATSDLKKELGPLGSAFSVFAAVATGRRVSQLASQVEELNSRFEIVFGTVKDTAQAFAEDLANSIGRSTNRVKGFLAALQDTFVPLGFTRDAAFELSGTLTQLAIDVASFTDRADADVLRDFQSAIVGNGETVRKYGIVLLEATIQQEAFNQGLDPKNLTEQQKVLLRTSIILKQTADAQGDAARTAGSFANQSKQLDDNLSDLGVAAGQVLNNFLTPFIQLLNEVVPLLANFIQENQTLAQVLLTVAASITGIVVVIKAFTIAILLGKVAIAAFNVALTATAATAAGAGVTVTILNRSLLALAGTLKIIRTSLIFITGLFLKFTATIAVIGGIAAVLITVVRRLTGEYDSLAESIDGTLNDLKAVFDAVFNSALELEDLVLILGATFEKLTARISNLFFKPVLGLFNGLVNAAKAEFQLMGNFILLGFENAISGIKTGINSVIIFFNDALSKVLLEAAKVAGIFDRELQRTILNASGLPPIIDASKNEEEIDKINNRISQLRTELGNAGQQIIDSTNIDLALAEYEDEAAAIEARLQAAIANNVRENTNERIEAERKIAAEEKKNRDAKNAEIDEQTRKELEAQQEILNRQIEAQQLRQQQDANAQALLDKFVDSQDTALDRIKEINQQIEGGIIFADQGSAQRDELQRQREEEFQASLTNLQQLREAATDDGQRTFIDRLISDLKKANEEALPETVSQINQIRVASANAASGPLTTMFESLINGSANARDAFKTFARDFIANIIRMISQMLALRAIAAVTGLPIGAAGGFSLARNEGGIIPGRGPNKDTVPATLTRGEYVVRRSSVDKYGAGFMNALNQGIIPQSALAGLSSSASVRNVTGRYQTGGSVSSGSERSAPAAQPIWAANDNSIDQMLGGGVGGFVRFIRKNRTEINSALDTDE